MQKKKNIVSAGKWEPSLIGTVLPACKKCGSPNPTAKVYCVCGEPYEFKTFHADKTVITLNSLNIALGKTLLNIGNWLKNLSRKI